MSELVTKEFLKSFGDKCKRIFKPLTAVVNAPDDNEYKYLIINTDLPWLDTWSVNIDISGKGFTNTYNSYYGDIKFFGNISNLGNWEGRGYSLVDNEVIGILIDNYLSEAGYKTRFVVLFFEPVKLTAIDIINYLGNNTSNVNISSIEFIHSLGGDFSYSYILGNIDYRPSTIGKIIRLELQSEVEQFLFKLPKKNDDSDLDGEYMNIPEDTTQIDSVNDSKWAKYIKTKHNIKLTEGDLKETIISFGGDNITEINVAPLEINNSVLGNTEGEWFGKVLVNSKGLVTAVEPEEPLLVATDTILGGIQIGYEENTVEKNYPVSIDENNKAYVHVPWNDTDTWNKVANSNDLGLIKVGYTTTDKNYAVLLDSEDNAYVNVPWKDTTYSIATNNVAGLIKTGFVSKEDKRAVQLDADGNAFVNIIDDNKTVYDYFNPHIDYNTSKYVQIVPAELSGNTDRITLFIQPLIDVLYSHCKEVVVLFKNTFLNDVIFLLNPYSQVNNTGITWVNMFDSSIVEGGLTIPVGKTLELVFTFWDVNDVSFNGGLSV